MGLLLCHGDGNTHAWHCGSFGHVRMCSFGYSHCTKSLDILTKRNGYLSCTLFAISTLGTEQRYKECARCVGYHPGGIEQ